MSQPPPGPPPGAPPRFPRGVHGRRATLAAIIAAMLIVAGFTLVAGIYTLSSLQGVRAIVIEPADLPGDVFICDAFHQSQGVLYDSGKRGRHYQLIGTCTATLDSLPETMISELEYRGWTVHTDGDGNLDSYNYASHEEMTAALSESGTDPTTTNIVVDVYTSVTRPPEFPNPTSSAGA